MPPLHETDIVNSATPLETKFVGVHPRLYATGAQLDAIKARCGREPWASFLRRARARADEAIRCGVDAPGKPGDIQRGVGCGLAHLAAVYRFTGEKRYLDAAVDHIHRMVQHDNWTTSLHFGHWAHGMAVAYDWLYHELSEEVRSMARGALLQRTRRVFDHWCAYGDAYSVGYAWNHSTVVHAGVVAACCAIWGEIDGAGRMLKFALEKARLQADALGDDGASAEGLAYGQYNADFQLKSMVLCGQLLGVDLLAESRFYREFPKFLLYSLLPRSAWGRGVAFLQMGDAEKEHWYGPDVHLRLVASRFRDGVAQWLADTLAATDANADSSCFLNLLWHDETIAPTPPDKLPLTHRFSDKDIQLFRSSWRDDPSLLAFKCGPNSGHHARRYRQNVSGGHMHPDAGHVMLHACGEWLLIDDGYTKKFTSYQNTVLVNGIGQTGEGATWFEDLEVRRGKPEGRIVASGSVTGVDYVIGDAAPAYEYAAKLRRFFRQVVYVRPDVWVIVDDLEAEAASTFEMRFHSPRPFVQAAANHWRMAMPRATLELWTLGPMASSARPIVDAMKGGGGTHVDHDLDALLVANAAPSTAARFVTVLHARPTDAALALAPSLVSLGDRLNLTLRSGAGVMRLSLRADAEPIVLFGEK